MPLPQPPIILTREGFREWLTKLPEGHLLAQGRPCHCAIAQHIEASLGNRVSVGPHNFSVWHTPGHWELPRWAADFVAVFDKVKNGAGQLVPAEAIRVLDSIR